MRDRFLLPRPVTWLPLAAAAGAGCWMAAVQVGPVGAEPHWLRYQLISRAAALSDSEVVDQSELETLDPESAAVARAKAEADRRRAALDAEQRMVAELIETVRWNPGHARAHLELAAAYLRLFENAQAGAVNRMPLGQVRDAAIAAGYTSRRELDEWLNRAVGDHAAYLDRALKHTRSALSLCPLLGRGYLYLGELCFLEGAGAGKEAFVEQALSVRPHDGQVLFYAGREAWLAGRFDSALEFWKRAFGAGRMYQREVIDAMAGQTVDTALHQEIEFLLEEFRPDLEGLRYMYHRYREIAGPDQLVPLLAVHAARSQERAVEDARLGRREEAAERWLDAMAALADLGDIERAAHCAEKATECNPGSFRAHFKAGSLYADMGRLSDAEEHLAWCVRCNPDHVPARRRLNDVKRKILDPSGLADRAGPVPYPPGTDFREARLHVPGPGTLPLVADPAVRGGPPIEVYRR